MASSIANAAPVALFVYRRHELLPKVLSALQACKGYADTPVFVFSDGAKRAADRDDVAQVRALIRNFLTSNMRLIESDVNLGLDPSIINGVNRVLLDHDRVIVIEDDLIVAPQILTWFNSALSHYENEPSVMQIAGHAFEAPELLHRTEGMFLPFSSSWGWATWRRAWDCFDVDATGWQALTHDPKLRHRFNLEGAYNYARMLRAHMTAAPSNQAWDIRWYWTIFSRSALCLYPPQTMVLNIGFEVKATHSHARTRIFNLLRRPRVLSATLPTLPSEVLVDQACYKAVRRAIRWRRL